MNDIERQLKDALRRCDPPANFANRVMARVAAENDEPLPRHPVQVLRRRWPMLRWAAAATLACLTAAGTGYRIHERNIEKTQAMAAKRQVMIALRITGAKLRIAKQRVRAVEDGQKTGKNL